MSTRWPSSSWNTTAQVQFTFTREPYHQFIYFYSLSMCVTFLFFFTFLFSLHFFVTFSDSDIGLLVLSFFHFPFWGLSFFYFFCLFFALLMLTENTHLMFNNSSFYPLQSFLIKTRLVESGFKFVFCSISFVDFKPRFSLLSR